MTIAMTIAIEVGVQKKAHRRLAARRYRGTQWRQAECPRRVDFVRRIWMISRIC